MYITSHHLPNSVKPQISKGEGVIVCVCVCVPKAVVFTVGVRKSDLRIGVVVVVSKTGLGDVHVLCPVDKGGGGDVCVCV